MYIWPWGLRHIAFVVTGPASNCCLYFCRRPDNGNSEDFLGINMIRLLVSSVSGLFFGFGLLISGMTDTAKVQGWLDILGQWDPTLAFVMGGAMIPMAAAWAIIAKKAPVFDLSFSMPSNKTIDFKLLSGSVLFGMGWALAGLCPGPAIAALGFGGNGIILFFVSMIVGMIFTKPMRMGSISTADG